MKTFFIGILLLFTAMEMSAQSVTYTYDNAGNRTARTFSAAKAPQAPDEFRDATALPELIAEKSVVIFPNPTKGILSVEIKDYTDNLQAEFRLTDLSGRTVIDRKISGDNQTFDLSRLAAGIYLLQIRINGESAVRKIIKE